MKKILVPTDQSAVSLKALDVAVDLARQNNAEVILLEVKVFPLAGAGTYYGMAPMVPLDTAWNEILKDAQASLAKIIANPAYEGVKIKAVVENSTDDIDNTVTRHKADLIVMGSTGASGLKEVFIGSHAEAIVRHANCPVFVVKGKVEDYKIRKVLVAIDFEHNEVMKKAFKWLTNPDIHFHFVYVDTAMQRVDYEKLKENMKELGNKLKIKEYGFEIWDGANVEEGILDSAHEIEADLILMYTHARKGLAHLFKGSVAEDVVNHSDIPVMTLS